MSRRLLLLILVPALVGTTVGVGAAALQRPRTTTQFDSATGADGEATAFQLRFSRAPSGLVATELPVADPDARRKRQQRAERDGQAPEFDVAEVQRRLQELKYYGGAIDGDAGSAFASAVMAFQKVQGIGADGAVGRQTLVALKDPRSPSLKGGSPNRIEVDLTKQVLYFVEGGALVRIMPVSSGNGATYAQKSGGTAEALTPVGDYAIQRKIPGARVADLGTLYDPMYFYQGWAIHGSNSVPAYPASHGCIRVTRADALWLYPRTPVGFQVKIYGGQFVFTAGSSAPGTTNPSGDTPDEAEPASKPEEPAQEPREQEPSERPQPDGGDKPGGGDGPDGGDRPDEEPTPGPKPSPKPQPSPTSSPKPKPSPTDDPAADPGD